MKTSYYTGSPVPDFFFFFQKALLEVKRSGQHLSFNKCW